MNTIGFYAGSFDPFTKGHLQIVTKAANCFDKVIIGIAYNSEKDVRIDKEKMKNAIKQTISIITVLMATKSRTISGCNPIAEV